MTFDKKIDNRSRLYTVNLRFVQFTSASGLLYLSVKRMPTSKTKVNNYVAVDLNAVLHIISLAFLEIQLG